MRAVGMLAALALVSAGCVVRTVVMPPLENLMVRGFVAHADREWPGTRAQQAQTADTLDWLASAIQSLATTRRLAVPELEARLKELRALIQEFARGKPDDPGQADRLRRSFVAGAGLIDDLLVGAGLADGGRTTAVRRAAEALDVGRLPWRQPDAIERYFQAASEAVQRVDRGV